MGEPLKEAEWPAAVLVDLDNTLHDYTRASELAVAGLANMIGRAAEINPREVQTRYEFIRRTLNDSPTNTGGGLRRLRIRQLLDTWPQTQQVDEQAIVAAFEQQLFDSFSLYTGARKVLETIRARCSVTIVTEGWEDVQTAILRRLGLPPNEWDTFITQAHGVRKHDSSAYLMILERIGVPAENVIMVGNNWDWDILAAAKVGINTIWISNGANLPQPPPDGFIGAVDRIENVLSILSF